MKTAKKFLKEKGIKDTLYDNGLWCNGGLSKLLKEYSSKFSDVSDEEIQKESERVIINYLTHNNPEGDFKESTIGADDKRIWWCIGAKAMRDGKIKKG